MALTDPGGVGLFNAIGGGSFINDVGLVDVDVAGRFHVGGLVGGNGGTVIASYATGSVSGGHYGGGLMGENYGAVVASYAIGRVSGSTNAGGLIGENRGTISASFWDIRTSGQSNGVKDGDYTGVQGKTTGDLQSPIGYTGIYNGWNLDVNNADRDFDPTTGGDDIWDFGTTRQYPVLNIDFDDDGSATWWEFGRQIGNRPTPTPTPTPRPTSTPTPTP